MKYTHKLKTILLDSGWHEGRRDDSAEREYAQTLGIVWLPVAAPFVREFGNLIIGSVLEVNCERIIGQLKFQARIEAVVGSKTCPLAFSWYMGDGGSLWIDAMGRYYNVDTEGVFYLASNVQDVMDVLIIRSERRVPPADISDALSGAENWDI